MTVSALDGVPGLGRTRQRGPAEALRIGGQAARGHPGRAHRSARDRRRHGGRHRRCARRRPSTQAGSGGLRDNGATSEERPVEGAARVCPIGRTSWSVSPSGKDADDGRHAPDEPQVHPARIEVAIVSGLSGAGRSTAAKALEDLGWFVVDNLPPELIATMVELGAKSRGSVTRIAVVVDVRSRAFTADLTAVIRDLDTRGYRPRAAVPRGVRRRADPPLRGEPPRAPAAARRPAGRRARRRTPRCSDHCGTSPRW